MKKTEWIIITLLLIIARHLIFRVDVASDLENIQKEIKKLLE